MRSEACLCWPRRNSGLLFRVHRRAYSSSSRACLNSSSRREEALASFCLRLGKPGCWSLLTSAATAEVGVFEHALRTLLRPGLVGTRSSIPCPARPRLNRLFTDDLGCPVIRGILVSRLMTKFR